MKSHVPPKTSLIDKSSSTNLGGPCLFTRFKSLPRSPLHEEKRLAAIERSFCHNLWVNTGDNLNLKLQFDAQAPAPELRRQIEMTQ